MDNITTDLLLEREIISKEEKTEIINKINRDFSASFTSTADVSFLSTSRLRGLFLPLFISILSIAVTILLLFLLPRTAGIEENQNALGSTGQGDQAEWAVLREYIEQSNQQLETKEREISTYRNRIKVYDERLETLRGLIQTKRDIEDKLSAEETAMKDRGVPSDDIPGRLQILEEQLIAEISPAIVEDYQLSIVELNRQIDQILENRSASEERLNESIEERKAIELKNEELKKEANQNSEYLTALEALEESEKREEQEKLFTDYLNGAYQEIYRRLGQNEYSAAQERITELRSAIQGNNNPDLLRDLENLNFLEKYAKLSADSGASPSVQNSSFEQLMNSLKQYNVTSIEELDSRNLNEIEESLSDSLAAVPEISRSVDILIRIREERNLEQYDAMLADFIDQVSSEAETQLAETVIDSDPTDGLTLLGRAAGVSFNRITILPEPGIRVQEGTKITIYRVNPTGEKTELGRGVISDNSGDRMRGRLEILSNMRLKPDVDDLIYFQQ